MKQIRRITMELVYRRQEIALIRQSLPAQQEAGDWTAAAATELPEFCPVCGSGWVLLHQELFGMNRPALPAVSAVFSSLQLHFHSTPEGGLWACRRSLDELGNRLKENL